VRDVNVTRLDVNAIAALRSRIVETVNNTQKPGYPPDSEDIFDGVCGFVSGQLSGQVPIETDDEGLALLSYIEAVVETETGYLFNKRYFELQREEHAELQREEHAMKVKSSMHKDVVGGSEDRLHLSEGHRLGLVLPVHCAR
jgi:hypothetical protein